MMGETKIVCICGSTRFLDQMAIAAWEMEKKGILVIGPHLLPRSYPGVKPSHQAEEEGIREVLDELHLRKIDLADEVYVVNVGGYIGESTRNELRYARATGKDVAWMEPDKIDGELKQSTPGPKFGKSGEWDIVEVCKEAAGIIRSALDGDVEVDGKRISSLVIRCRLWELSGSEVWAAWDALSSSGVDPALLPLTRWLSLLNLLHEQSK